MVTLLAFLFLTGCASSDPGVVGSTTVSTTTTSASVPTSTPPSTVEATPDTVVARSEFRVVGYINTWDRFPESIGDIDLSALTQINIAFANPDDQGDLGPIEGLDEAVSAIHAAGPDVVLSLGGADLGGSEDAWRQLTAPSKVDEFCDRIVSYAIEHDLDGIDIDLEGDIIGDQYAPFVAALADRLHAYDKTVTAAVATWFIDQIPPSTFADFDHVNIMSYDATGPWDPDRPGPHSSFEMAVSDLETWIGYGLPAEKAGVGVPFYGYGFGSYASKPEYSYAEIVAEYPDAAAHDQIGTAGNAIYYNGPDTIRAKTEMALRQAGGVMIWQLTSDATGDESLLAVITSTVNG